MTAYEIISILLSMVSLLISASNAVIALLNFLDKRNKQ